MGTPLNLGGIQVPPPPGILHAVEEDVPMLDVEDLEKPPESGDAEQVEAIDRVALRVEKELLRHRLSGHAQFHPDCLLCRSAKGVTHHRRQSKEQTAIEVYADFGFLPQKFLAMVEPDSMARHFVLVNPLEKAQAEITRFFNYLGISRGYAILVRTDAEIAVGNLLKGVVSCRVERAAPQAHESVGHAERCIRFGKGMFATLRLDMQALGFDVTEAALQFALSYVANMSNHHRMVHGSDRSAHDWLSGQSRSKPTSCAFLSICLAEAPDSIDTPAGSRWIQAAYLGPVMNQQGILVSGVVLDADKNPFVKIFQARSVKALSKIAFDVTLCPEFLQLFEVGDGSARPNLPGRDVENASPIPENIGKSGPPADWLRTHGLTPGCYACDRSGGGKSFHGRVHSKACCDRYRKWRRDQESKIVPPSSASGVPDYKPRYRHVEKSPPLPDDYEPRLRVAPPVPDVDVGGLNDDDYSPEYLPTPSPKAMSDADEPMNIPIEEDDGGSMEISKLSSFMTRWSHDWETELAMFGFGLSPLYLPRVGIPTEYEKFTLVGKEIFLARPLEVWNETRTKQLDVDKACEGRLVELGALNKVKFGRLLGEREAKRLAAESGTRVIPTRWVVTEKEVQVDELQTLTVQGVRMRLVVQEVASGSPQASHLGLSSNTPSSEAIRAMLTWATETSYYVWTLDVSTAFMHAYVPDGLTVVLRMPGDLSWTNDGHTAVFAQAYRSLNGLRCASKAWLSLATGTICSKGLKASTSEPCVLHGTFVDGKFSAQMTICIYVDDILLISPHPEAGDRLRQLLLQKVEKVKVTGWIGAHKEGSVVFLGREVKRFCGNKGLVGIRVPTDYLKELVDGLRATDVVPNLSHEKDAEKGAELEDAAATAYRSKLGRLSWWAQTRQDVLPLTSFLATGQSKPFEYHEKALTRVLRYVKSNLHFYHLLGAEDVPSVEKAKDSRLVIFTDASWSDRSISGYCIFWKGGALKSCSRHQQAVALSSCEAEIVALVQGIQEGLGILRLVHFLYGDLETELSNIEEFLQSDVESLPHDQMLVLTDSRAALLLLSGEGLSRRSRHLSIVVAFLQRLIRAKVVTIEWIPTGDQVADLLTKTLQKDLHYRHLWSLGYREESRPEAWQIEPLKPGGKKALENQPLNILFEVSTMLSHADDQIKAGRKFIILEICSAGKHSGLVQFARKSPLFVCVFVTRHDPIEDCWKLLCDWLSSLPENCKILIWMSPPCTGGSPALNFIEEDRRCFLRKQHWTEFLNILDCLKPILKVRVRCEKLLALELSHHCSYWDMPEIRDFLDEFKMSRSFRLDRCRFAKPMTYAARHSFRIHTTDSWLIDQICRCESHAAFSAQSLDSLGRYPYGLARFVIEQLKRHWM